MTAPTVARPRARATARATSPALRVAPRGVPRRDPRLAPARVAVSSRAVSAARVRLRVLFLFVLSAVALLTIVAFHVVIAQGQVNLDRIAEQTAKAEDDYENIRLDHATLAAPDRILARAGELGLVTPTAPPIPVPVEGWEPPAPIDSSATLDAWTAVKPSLEPRA